MSKTALKKKLESLTREQIIDVVLTAYSSNKSIKDYFDFFAMPDVEKLYEKFMRELTRKSSAENIEIRQHASQEYASR